MLHKTKAIILKTLPYGDTSLIVSAYTELFGLQSYIVKGARRVSKKGSSLGQYLQPAALLEMVVYRNELKQLQLVKELRWSRIYRDVFSDVTKYAVALYMVELLSKCIRQTETNPELFAFAEDNFIVLDDTPLAVAANLPLHFSLHLAGKMGFQIEDNFGDQCQVLDLQEGRFTAGFPQHPHFLEGSLSEATFQLLQMNSPVTLYRLKLNQQHRRQLLTAYETFFEYHISDFGRLKSLSVLQELLG